MIFYTCVSLLRDIPILSGINRNIRCINLYQNRREISTRYSMVLSERDAHNIMRIIFTCVLINFSSVWVAEWSPFGQKSCSLG